MPSWSRTSGCTPSNQPPASLRGISSIFSLKTGNRSPMPATRQASAEDLASVDLITVGSILASELLEASRYAAWSSATGLARELRPARRGSSGRAVAAGSRPGLGLLDQLADAAGGLPDSSTTSWSTIRHRQDLAAIRLCRLGVQHRRLLGRLVLRLGDQDNSLPAGIRSGLRPGPGPGPGPGVGAP